MAKIHEETISIKISQLVRDGQEPEPCANDTVVDALAEVAQELVGTGAIVEIVKE